jgi:hypothetical protein
LPGERVIADVGTSEEAKRVEETVKTGFSEVLVETVAHWIAVEEDLAESYEQLATRSEDPLKKEAYSTLGRQSTVAIEELKQILEKLEELDSERAGRVARLGALG